MTTPDDDDESIICNNRSPYAEMNSSVRNEYKANLEALQPEENEIARLSNIEKRAVGERGFQVFLRKKEIEIAISKETLDDLEAAEEGRLAHRSRKRSKVQPTEDDYTLEEASTMNSVSLGATSTKDDGSMTIMTNSFDDEDNEDEEDEEGKDEEEEEDDDEDDDIISQGSLDNASRSLTGDHDDDDTIDSQYVADDTSRTLLTHFSDDDTIPTKADDRGLDQSDNASLGPSPETLQDDEDFLWSGDAEENSGTQNSCSKRRKTRCDKGRTRGKYNVKGGPKAKYIRPKKLRSNIDQGYATSVRSQATETAMQKLFKAQEHVLRAITHSTLEPMLDEKGNQVMEQNLPRVRHLYICINEVDEKCPKKTNVMLQRRKKPQMFVVSGCEDDAVHILNAFNGDLSKYEHVAFTGAGSKALNALTTYLENRKAKK